MTKLELAKELAQAERISQTKALSIIENLMDLITCHFQNGGKQVTLRGFGTFKTYKRRGFTGRDPRTGDPIKIVERLYVGLRPSAEMLRRIN